MARRADPLTPFAGRVELGAVIYVDDVDSAWQRAIEAGAEVVFPLELQFYGDKGGRLLDPFGHTWGLAEHVEDVSPEEMQRRMAQFYDES